MSAVISAGEPGSAKLYSAGLKLGIFDFGISRFRIVKAALDSGAASENQRIHPWIQTIFEAAEAG
jgi:hypothetical protein